MSWQTYVDANLVGTGKIARAAILGQQGGLWAKSAGYEISPTEQKDIVGAFNNQDAVRTNGIRLAGRKFLTLSCNERSLYGKQKADGCVVVKTKQAILVAEYLQPIQAAEATPIVEAVADYLISAGY